MRLLLLALLLALGSSAYAQHLLQWERFHVSAVLDNDGQVRVSETLEVFLNGQIPRLDRVFAECAMQRVVAPQVSEMAADGTFRPIADAEYRPSERAFYWRIAPDDAPEWQDTRKTFRLEYELRGVVAPAWDLPIGPGSFLDRGNFPHLAERLRETLEAWRQPPRRYRFDHDVLFARFSNEGPRELNYTFRYGTAWRHPEPDAPLRARVTPDVNYRVTELRDYLRPGRPPAVEDWPATVRRSAIAASVVIPLLLWLAFSANRLRVHGWSGPQLDRAWFRTHILPLIPERLPTPNGPPLPSRFARFLARMRQRRVLEIHESATRDGDGHPVLRLQLLTSLASLPRFERALLGRLFADRREITTAELGKVYAETGFVPADAMDAAFDEAVEIDDEPARVPRAAPASFLWKLLGIVLPPLALAAAGLLLFDAFTSDYNDGISVPFSLCLGFAALAGLSLLVRPLGGWGKSLVGLVPIVALIVAGLACHFHHVLPPSPAASAGLALLVICLSGIWLLILVNGNAKTPEDLVLELARRYALRELRKPHPALEDTWLPHLLPLVGTEAIRRWQLRFGDADDSRIATPLDHDGPPFTGHFPLDQETRWATQLRILSRRELAEIDALEPEDRPGP